MRLLRTLDARLAAMFIAGLFAPCAMAQFNIDGREVDIHGFFTQGFMYSTSNNYLTAQTSAGSFGLTDGGVNVSSQISSNFHVGAQAYTRNVGELGNFHVTLDWATGDYRFNDWFGIRAGQVKTVLGLYNDTQDLEFLHTWALLPQSVYPLDLRGLTISHLGGDVYGSVPVKRVGTFSYTAYVGKAPADLGGGEQFGLSSYGFSIRSRGGNMAGLDVKWTTPIPGLQLGAALLDSRQSLRGLNLNYGGDFSSDTVQHTTMFSAEYSHGPWKIDWERSRVINNSTLGNVAGAYLPSVITIPTDQRAWYAAISYRVSKHLELGTYQSRFYPNSNQQVAYSAFLPWPARHVFDQAVTARLDFKTYWDVKIEGHFMDGYGEPGSSRGFYPQVNPQGLEPKTSLLVIRLGFNR